MKKHKKNNITPDNIGEIMLSNIPGVSNKTAITIMKDYSSISKLIKMLESDEMILNDIRIMNDTGISRKISKTAVENIKKFLLV